MDNDIRLFGKKRKKDWVELRNKLLADSGANIWPDTLDLMDKRLSTRYFKPIKKVLGMSLENGEGFAAMTLICSLIEFLQSLYEGKIYRYNAPETNLEYGQSGPKFKSFLEQHEPFKIIFTSNVPAPAAGMNTYADDFYKSVRCGLLHEAATNNGWTIRSTNNSSWKGEFVFIGSDGSKIIYREAFVEEIMKYIKDYKQKIMNNEKDSGGLF